MKQTDLKSNYAVKRSSSGLGLFAKKFIPKESFVIEYTGELIDNDEAQKRGGRYLFEINSKWTVDGTGRENLARYINHSCRPNCEVRISGKRILVYSIKNIKVGEELCYDYGKDYFNDLIKPAGCKCASCLSKKSLK